MLWHTISPGEVSRISGRGMAIHTPMEYSNWWFNEGQQPVCTSEFMLRFADFLLASLAQSTGPPSFLFFFLLFFFFNQA